VFIGILWSADLKFRPAKAPLARLVTALVARLRRDGFRRGALRVVLRRFLRAIVEAPLVAAIRFAAVFRAVLFTARLFLVGLFLDGFRNVRRFAVLVFFVRLRFRAALSSNISLIP
jgi:hypothetical protein